MPTHAQVPPAQRQRTGQVNDLLPLGDWIRHHSLRSWPVLLFLALICVPSIALVILGPNPSATTFDHVAWMVTIVSGILFLGYAKVGSRSDLEVPERPPATVGGAPRPWWEH